MTCTVLRGHRLDTNPHRDPRQQTNRSLALVITTAIVSRSHRAVYEVRYLDTSPLAGPLPPVIARV